MKIPSRSQPALSLRSKSEIIALEHPAAHGRTMHAGSNAGDGAADSTTFSLILISVRENARSNVGKYSRCSHLEQNYDF